MPGPRREEVVREARARRRRARWLRLLFVLLLLPILGLGIVTLLNQEKFLIHDWQIVGLRTLSAETMSQSVNTVLTGKYFGLLSKRSFLFYPEQKIIETLQAQFEKVLRVSLVREGLSRLVVLVQEREPIALWCGAGDLPECYLLDDTGLAYSRAPIFSDYVLPEFRSNKTVVGLGVRPLSTPVFTHLLYLGRALEGIIPLELNFHADWIRAEEMGNGDWRFVVRERFYPLRYEWPMLVHETAAVGALARNFTAALENRAVFEELKNRRAELEYLDFRFADKIFYKFR